MEIDKNMLQDEQIKEQMAGTTAICCLIRDNKLYCANAGDSRAIACRNGTLVTLSNDHKPNNPEEMDRIYNAGECNYLSTCFCPRIYVNERFSYRWMGRVQSCKRQSGIIEGFGRFSLQT